MATNRVAWSGTCQDCVTIITIAPHYETPADVAELIAEGPQEWESFSNCYVCGGTIDWNGSDPVEDVLRHY